jgi:hypothetical protein
VRRGLLGPAKWKLFGVIFSVSMQGEKVVKLPESPFPEFPGGKIIEFSREWRQGLRKGGQWL